MLLVGSAAIVTVDAAKRSYHGTVVSSPFGDEGMTVAEIMCSVTDPVIAAMLLLATDGVAVDRIPAPDWLNKRRVKAGKPAIPAHWRVRTAEYVTALTAPRRSGVRGDGHHASPAPHLRRGHPRRLADRTVWVRDALVNLKDDPGRPLGRAFYALRRGDDAAEAMA
jgi:hypothetical protein